MCFAESFKLLTGNSPYPWQQRMFKKFRDGNVPEILDIPTGLGKTSIIAIWLLALAHARKENQNTVPTRLVYIVDRRVIVDQATTEVENIQEILKNNTNSLIKSISNNIGKDLNVSKLRGGGGMDDNRAWLKNPHKPAIIIGTIDMIGSRLLFSGYGIGKKTRSFYSGLLGQDSLIVLDETHLSPAMERMLKDVRSISHSLKIENRLYPPKILLMSATQHDKSADRETLCDDDHKLLSVKKRYMASKKLELKVCDKNEVQNEIFNHSSKMRGRILIYVQKPDHAKSIAEKLRKEKNDEDIIVLTGTIRGFERDNLTKNKAYNAFLSNKQKQNRTVYMVSTSAGEVGADFDADHMVCDMTTMDSLIQRLGRLNRSGRCAISKVVVVYSKDEFTKKGEFVKRKKATADILEKLSNANNNVGPYWLDKITPEEKYGAFSPRPDTQPLTKEVLDMWSMTSIYRTYSSRPHVKHWLHGKPESFMPEAYVVWRNDVEYLINATDSELEHLFERYRILPQEIVRDSTKNICKFLTQLKSNDNVIVITNDAYERCSVSEAVQKGRGLDYATIILPCKIGGLDSHGFLDATSKKPVLDVADMYNNKNQRRLRILVKEREEETGSLIRYVEKNIGANEEMNKQFDEWYKSMPRLKLVYRQSTTRTDDDELVCEVQYYKVLGRQLPNIQKSEKLHDHLKKTEKVAEQILKNFSIPSNNIKDAIIVAARHHDAGKSSDHWQQCMWVEESDRPMAKTTNKKKPLDLGGFRHELLSTHMAIKNSEIRNHVERDLILHLIASHHGWARPCFRPNATKHSELDHDNTILLNVSTRYSQLQKRFGAFGLAWLEGILRGSDWAASDSSSEEI